MNRLFLSRLVSVIGGILGSAIVFYAAFMALELEDSMVDESPDPANREVRSQNVVPKQEPNPGVPGSRLDVSGPNIQEEDWLLDTLLSDATEEDEDVLSVMLDSANTFTNSLTKAEWQTLEAVTDHYMTGAEDELARILSNAPEHEAQRIREHFEGENSPLKTIRKVMRIAAVNGMKSSMEAAEESEKILRDGNLESSRE